MAGGVIVLVGIIDDRWGLDALTKFVGQVTAAGVLVVMGVSWIIIYDPFVTRFHARARPDASRA